MNEDKLKKFYENTKRINQSFTMSYDDFCIEMGDPIKRKKFYENTRKLNPSFTISDDDADTILGYSVSDNQSKQEPKQSFGSKLLQNAGPFVPAGGNMYGMALAEKKEQERQAEETEKREKERRHQSAMTIGITDQDKKKMAQRDALKQKVNTEFLLDGKKFSPSKEYTPFNEDGSFNPIGTTTSENAEPTQAQKYLAEYESQMPSYLTRGEKTQEDIFVNAEERFRNTEEGKKAMDEIMNKYIEEFKSSDEFQQVLPKGVDEVNKEFVRLYGDRMNAEYEERVLSVMKDYIDDANDRLGVKNTDKSVIGLNNKLQYLQKSRVEFNEFTDVSDKEIQERYLQEHGSTMQQDIKDPAAVMAIRQAYYEKIHKEKYEEALERGMIPVNGNRLLHAEKYINKSTELIDAVKNDKGFFGAMGTTLSDIDTWSMGLTEIGGNLDVMNICKKLDENGGNLDALSEDEQFLLESVTTYMATCAYYSPKLNRSYKAGQTTAASIPFMLSIMLGSGVTKATGQGVVKALGMVAERMLGKYAEKTAIKVTGQVAGKAVETLVRSEIMTATFGAPKVAAGTIERMTGDIGFRFVNDGKIEHNGRENQQDFGEALWNSHADTFIEYWSEDAFSVLDPLGVAIRGSKWFGNIAKKAGGNYVIQDIIKLRNQPWFRNLRESTQFQSFPEEVLEEELGGLLRIGLTTDTKIKNEDGSTNWEQTWKNAGLDIDSQIDIVLGLAPTSLFMGSVGAAGLYGNRAINYANFKKNLSSEEDKKLFQQIMKETRSGEFADKAHTLIRNILANDNLSAEQKGEMITDIVAQNYKVLSGELQGMYRQTQVEPIIDATRHEGSDVIFNTTDDKGRKICIVGGKLQFMQQDTDNGPVDMIDKENSDEKVRVRVYGKDGSISQVYEVDASTLTNPITHISNSDMRDYLNAQKHAIFNGDKTFTVGENTFNTDTGELVESELSDTNDNPERGNAVSEVGHQSEQSVETAELEGYLKPVNTRPHIMDSKFAIRMPNGTIRVVRITSRSVALNEDGTINEKRSVLALRNEQDKIILGDEKQQCLAAINDILRSDREKEIEEAKQKKALADAAKAKAEQKENTSNDTPLSEQENSGAPIETQDGSTPAINKEGEGGTPVEQVEEGAPVQENGAAPVAQQEKSEQQDEQPSEPTEEEQWNAAVTEATSMQKADGTFKPDATPAHKVVAMIGEDKTGVQDAVDVAKAEIADIDETLSTIDVNKKLSATDKLFRKRKLASERQAWIDAIRKYVSEEAAASLETPAAPITQETPAAVEDTPVSDNGQNNAVEEEASQENAQATVGDFSMGDTEGAPVAQSQAGNEETVSEQDAQSIIKQIEDEAEEAEEIELTPENWYAQFGEDGIVETPIGKVKMGDNQYLKLAQKGREGKLGMIKPTLERPTIIIEDNSKANEGQETERESSFIFVKAFVGKDGKRVYYFTSVTVKKDGQEVVVSNQEKTKNRISKLIQQGKLTWINNNSIPHPTPRVEGSVLLNGSRKPTDADNQPTVLGINPSGIEENSSSDGKGSENNPNDQTFDEENAEKVENESENGVSAGVNINPMSPDFALVKTSDSRVEFARVVMDEEGNPAYYSISTNKPIKRTAIDKNIVYLKDANGGYQPYVLMSVVSPEDIKHHKRNTYRLMDMNGNTLDINSNELFYQEEGSDEYIPAVESKKNTDTPDSILNMSIYRFPKTGRRYTLKDLLKEGFTDFGRGQYINPYDKFKQLIASETGLTGNEFAEVIVAVNDALNNAISRWNRLVELRGYDEQLANSTGLDYNVMTSMYGDKRTLRIRNMFNKRTNWKNVENPICQLIVAIDMAQQMGLIEEGTFNVSGEGALRRSIPKKWLSKSDVKNEKESAKATYDELDKQYNTLKAQRDALQQQLDDNPNMPYTDSRSIKSAIDEIKKRMNDVADEMEMLDDMRMQRTDDTEHATSAQVSAIAEQLQKAMPNTEVVVAQNMEEATAVMAERTGMSEEDMREELGNGIVAGASLPDGSVVLVADSVRIDTPFHEFAHKLYAFAKKNGGPLLEAINKYIEQAPQAIKDYVASHYPDAVGTDAYLDEVFAWALSEQSGKKMEQFLAERGLGSKDLIENMRQQAWYSKMWNAIKQMWESIKTEFSNRFGSQYADMSVFDAYQTMSAEEIGNSLYDMLMGGKELSEQKNAQKSSKDLVNSKKNRNFAIVNSGRYNRLAINITQNVRQRPQGALINSDFSIEKDRIIKRAKADGTYMKAPNGKPSNLSEDRWAAVRTKAFKQWFGDWEKDPENASKVVDKNGEPLVVYHGSQHAGFDTFRLRGYGSQGIYTTPSRETANSYASSYTEKKDGINQEDAVIGGEEHHGIYPLFVNIRNPKTFDFEGMEWLYYGTMRYTVLGDGDELGNTPTPIFDTVEEAEAYARIQGGEENGFYVMTKYTTSDELLMETLDEGSYDGCIFTNYKDGHPRGETITSYVPFSPNQLKSATQNSGEYSTSDARINHQIIGGRGEANQDNAEENVKNSLFAAKVPKSEIAVARNALFGARFGQKKLTNPIGVYYANYYHIFQNNTHIGSILIEGNEEDISTLNKLFNNGTYEDANEFSKVIEGIRSGQKLSDSHDFVHEKSGRGNAGIDKLHNQQVRAGEPSNGERDRGKVSRTNSSVSTGGGRNGGIRLQVTGGGYYSNSDFAPVDPKKAEAIKKKSEEMKHSVKTAMSTPSVVRKKTAAWLAAKTAAVLDRTEGVRRLDVSLDEWLKANGRKGTHMKYNVRQRIEAANGAIRYRVKQLEKKELRHLNDVVRSLVKEVEGSAMYNKYKIEKQPDVYGEQIYLTPVEFIERYLISRDNMERYDMGIDRGLQEFKERMGVDMAAFMEEFEKTYFSGKEGEAKRKELWDAIRDVTDISLNEALDSGIISEESYNTMMNRKFYVPERDYAAQKDEEDSDGVVKNRRKNKIKPASMAKAKGGNSLADNILAHIMDDAIDSITKAEKNRVKLCMYKMLTENKEWCREIGIPIPTEVYYIPNGDGTYSRRDNAPTAEERIAYAETMQVISELKNELITTADESVNEAIKIEIQKLESSLPYIDAATASKLFVQDAKENLSSVCVMVDGVANEMMFPHMEYVADALNDRYNKRGQIDIIKKITGFIAAQFTVNNPTFFAVNICRDVPYVLTKGAAEYGITFQFHFTKNFATSQRAVWRYLTDKETLDKETSQLLQQFLNSGGQMGYSSIPDIYQMKANVEALNKAGEQEQNDGAYYTSMVLSLGTARLANTLNDWSEIITRFAAYKSVIDMGIGHEEAMKASANLSCNFNRRGLGNTFFNLFGSLSMFVNAALQGASGFYRSFDTKKHAASAFGELMVAPAFFGFLSTLLSPDDDDEEFAISDFDRDNYFCLGNYRIPLNEQLKPFWVIGVNIALGMRGRRNASEIANSIISSLVRNLLPLPQNITNTAIMFTEFATGNKDEWNIGKAINSMFMPEALKTSVQLAQNENFLGNKIRYNTGDRPQIDFDDNEAQLYQDICELFYLLGGGKDGSHSLTKEDGSKVRFDFGAKELKQYMFAIPQGTQDILLSAYGIGKATVQSVRDDVPMKDAIKENVRWRDVPIANRFYHPADSVLFRYSIKKEATALVYERSAAIENAKRELTRYAEEKRSAHESGNFELEAKYEELANAEIRKITNLNTKEFQLLEEMVKRYNESNYAKLSKNAMNMSEKEFKKHFPDIEYDKIDDYQKNLTSCMLTYMYIMDGNEKIDKKIPEMTQGALGGAETVKEYFENKKASGE